MPWFESVGQSVSLVLRPFAPSGPRIFPSPSRSVRPVAARVAPASRGSSRASRPAPGAREKGSLLQPRVLRGPNRSGARAAVEAAASKGCGEGFGGTPQPPRQRRVLPGEGASPPLCTLRVLRGKIPQGGETGRLAACHAAIRQAGSLRYGDLPPPRHGGDYGKHFLISFGLRLGGGARGRAERPPADENRPDNAPQKGDHPLDFPAISPLPMSREAASYFAVGMAGEECPGIPPAPRGAFSVARGRDVSQTAPAAAARDGGAGNRGTKIWSWNRQ